MIVAREGGSTWVVPGVLWSLFFCPAPASSIKRDSTVETKTKKHQAQKPRPKAQVPHQCFCSALVSDARLSRGCPSQ